MSGDLEEMLGALKGIMGSVCVACTGRPDFTISVHGLDVSICNGCHEAFHAEYVRHRGEATQK